MVGPTNSYQGMNHMWGSPDIPSNEVNDSNEVTDSIKDFSNHIVSTLDETNSELANVGMEAVRKALSKGASSEDAVKAGANIIARELGEQYDVHSTSQEGIDLKKQIYQDVCGWLKSSGINFGRDY